MHGMTNPWQTIVAKSFDQGNDTQYTMGDFTCVRADVLFEVTGFLESLLTVATLVCALALVYLALHGHLSVLQVLQVRLHLGVSTTDRGR
jgi:hypothetical protein